ncbi:MAG: LacI family DNA-binding transcriptional regulator [Erysipelotrichaceae bacterium]|nr:LacI family DNA-binding transcriptional regulator [Erysipelotrichaceae bacterium]MDP3305842.1 LacI family DNA-binding transcriptional regulator [Erysipelotrichaceae bacterium]
MNKVTLLDLERISGVSKTTVSRYLSGERVKKDKEERIELAIKESGYIRNNFAQLLRSSQSNLIGVTVPDLDNPFFLKIIKRLDQLASERGKTLIIKTTNRSVETELKVIEFIRGFLVESIFLCRSELSESEITKLKFSVPVISLDKEFSNIDSVVSNNYQSAYDLNVHLINQSKQVMFFSRLFESTSVHQRVQGFKDSCAAYKKEPHEYKYNVNLPIDFNDLFNFVLSNKIDGIICRNDNEALKVLSFFNQKRAQGDIYKVKVCGFDNISLSKHIVPRLTTVDQKVEEMCDIAFELSLRKENKDPQIMVHESEIIIRESTRKDDDRI